MSSARESWTAPRFWQQPDERDPSLSSTRTWLARPAADAMARKPRFSQHVAGARPGCGVSCRPQRDHWRAGADSDRRELSVRDRRRRCGHAGIGDCGHWRGARLSIGRSVYVGAYCNIRCSGEIAIGEDARLAQFVSIVDANYSFHERDLPITETVHVRIGPGAWIAAQVVVLPGVDIGEGAVIGAGSVVTRSVPAFAIAPGNPAKVIGYRGQRRPHARDSVVAEPPAPDSAGMMVT
jgi:acetyltransferase-like isoleucine patch superfamily enzyme